MDDQSKEWQWYESKIKLLSPIVIISRDSKKIQRLNKKRRKNEKSI